MNRYNTLFLSDSIDTNNLEEQFLTYQLLVEGDIPTTVKECVGLSQEDYFRVVVMWTYLKNVKKPGSNECELDMLFSIAEVVITILHLNAGQERIFSLINKNKTSSHSSLNLDSSLLSIITVKTHIEQPLEWKLQQVYLKKLKRQPNITMTHRARSRTMFSFLTFYVLLFSTISAICQFLNVFKLAMYLYICPMDFSLPPC